ncbi:MAG: hypothetical protein HYV09_21730 [Deltaproteobacteria bacterium]|nr:hypothetical protein [Deltaproteobacteria bacterium]
MRTIRALLIAASMLSLAACGHHRRAPAYGGPPAYAGTGPEYTAPAANGFAVGQRVQVEWKGSWWPAVVVQSQPGLWFIHYEGYDNSWDEWVGPARIRVMPAPGVRAVGAPVSVEWKGSWYPATILSIENGRYFVHYDGYDNSWDEWVGPERVRDP